MLNQVALGVVPDAEGRLLIERYDLRTVNSTKDLLWTNRAPKNQDAVVVGNPKFLLSVEQQRAALRQVRQDDQKATVLLASAATPATLTISRSRDLRAERGVCSPPPPPGGTLCPLPGTAAEITSIADLLQTSNWTVRSYHDETALKEVVKGVRHPRVLHVATHGFFLADQKATLRSGALAQEDNRSSGMEDPMLRSGLLFAGADRTLRGDPAAEDVDDGVLTAYEASTLDLQGTELVVLSACETGLGEQQKGEGVFGLRRALQEAGAEAVLMSMWSVPDRETQELMTKFYGHWLSGMEKHEALRRAQLEEREIVQKRYGKDLPYYWGAFVLVGR
jgi:CHAT domain-containing protein